MNNLALFPTARVPVNVGLARLALRFNAVVVAVETGLFKSEVSSTLLNPTMDFVMPPTVPVNVGLARLALRANELVNPVLFMAPPTNKLLVKETSDKTDNLLFIETSPEETTVPPRCKVVKVPPIATVFDDDAPVPILIADVRLGFVPISILPLI